MTIEMIDGRSTIHACNCKDATPCMNDCTCNVNKVSDIIDADQERKIALLNSREELCSKIADIAKEYDLRRDLVLAPLLDALSRTDKFLEELDRPLCFGTYTCSDRDLESCPVERSGACYRKVRGCC